MSKKRDQPDLEGQPRRKRGQPARVHPILDIEPPPPPAPPPPLTIIPGSIPEDIRTPTVSAHVAKQLREVIVELARRKVEALNLYEPLPLQEEFHKCRAPERIIRGSNRSGKTLGAAVEVARAVCGLDPYDKYPKEGGRWFCVAKDGKEIGQVVWRKLGRPNAFRIIRDRKTGLWRAYRPWDHDDLSREAETKPSPPLIPRRLIKSIAWENKKLNIPSIVTLTNGWEISFFSSNAKPPTGSDIDGAWFDEEIEDPDWYPELAARLVDRNGKFIWSATPQAGTDQLYALHECADRQRGLRFPTTVEFVALIDDNRHMTDEKKQRFAEKLSDEERRVRIGGDFALASYRVYPEYSKATHEVPWREIPDHWTRYMVIDPGRQVCAVLFAAITPPEEGDYCYLYDELYLKNCDAEIFGREVKNKSLGQTFQSLIIDHQGARIHEMASGKSVEMQYSDALRKHGIRSVETGYDFRWASDDIQGGILAFRGWLRRREGDLPKIRILSDRLPNLDWELKRYHYRREKGQVTDKPEQRNNHLVDCCRYLVMANPKYHRKRIGKKPESDVVRYLRLRRERQAAKDGPQLIRLGPGASR